MLRILALLLSILALPASAGPWPQDKGRSFASASLRLVWPEDLRSAQPESTYLTLYFEHGVTERLTVGLDLGHSVSGQGKSMVFARSPLPAPGDWVAAAEIGLGLVEGAQVVRPGLSVGRGLRMAHGWGWVSADMQLEHRWQSGGTDLRLDLTLGTPLPRDRKLILQLQTGRQEGDPAFARLAPSMVMPLPNGLKLEAGGSVGLTGRNGLGLMVGLWHSF